MPSRTVQELPGQDQRVAGCPALSDFVAAVNAELVDQPVEAFWACEPVFRAFLGTHVLNDLISFEIGRIAKEPFYGPPGSGDYQYTIYISDLFALNMFLIDRDRARRARLQAVTRHCFLGVASVTPVNVDLYVQKHDIRPDMLDRSAVLENHGRRELHRGQVIPLHAGREIGDLQAEGESVVVSLVSRPVHDILWEYDRSTLAPVRAVSDNLASSRIEYALEIVSQVGDQSCVPVLLEMFEHPAHYVRWSVVKNVMRLDSVRGMELLRRALDDQHEHVRNAARISLNRLSNLDTSVIAR